MPFLRLVLRCSSLLRFAVKEPCKAGIRDQRNNSEIGQALFYQRQTGQVGSGVIGAGTFQYQNSFVLVGTEIGFAQNARLVMVNNDVQSLNVSAHSVHIRI